jgi:hypothetical protein
MKKKPQTEYHTLSVIVSLMQIQCVTMQQWWEIMDIEIPGMSTAMAAAKVLEEEDHEDPYGTVDEIADEYIYQRGRDVYEVRWPEHCIHRYFNSDATYRLEKLSPRKV